MSEHVSEHPTRDRVLPRVRPRLAAILRSRARAVRGFAAALRRVWPAFWRFLRQWSGDAAYETYAARVAEGERLSPQAFYLDSLRRRYRAPNRCC